jgi:ribosomal protein L11 methyltransferase
MLLFAGVAPIFIFSSDVWGCPEAVFELELNIDEAHWPALESVLEEVGALAVTQSGGDSAMFGEPGVVNTRLWRRFTVVALFDAEADSDALCRAIASVVGDSKIKQRRIEDQAWVDVWKASWQPQMFAGELCVCPSWCEAPAAARHVIHLDPGQAFGTGTHATTALCLDWLAAAAPFGAAHIVDYGCGSGILALAANKFGATSVAAVDIDSVAVAVAGNNVTLNKAAAAVRVTLPDALKAQHADILIANILLEPLIALESEFVRLLATGGRIVLSGLLASQVPEIVEAYAPDFLLQDAVVREEWALLSGQLR